MTPKKSDDTLDRSTSVNVIISKISNPKSKANAITKPNIDQSDLAENSLLATSKPLYVVGIVASAGGVAALEALFTQMPHKTGMAYVIIQHLSSNCESMTAELLSQKTMIPIKVIKHQMLLEVDTVYLLTTKKELFIENGKLLLPETSHSKALKFIFDIFFSSLAQSYQKKSIAIVLSGTGSDGSKGISKVHDSGGYVLVQTPSSCKFGLMPENAIKTDKVDLIIAPQSMPDALVKYLAGTSALERQLQTAMDNLTAQSSEFHEILILLNDHFGLDFNQCKPATIIRNIKSRISYQKISSLKIFIDILSSNKKELEAFYYDLQIGVPQFFSDFKTFTSLRSNIPQLLENFKDEAEIRIWVAGCSTGQEAYSIAMIMQDIMRNDHYGDKPLKIFATDIHHLSITKAAKGIYNESEVIDLEDDLKVRLFSTQSNNTYQVVPEIRKSIFFVQHNWLKDPPFTCIHLLCCRNSLVYLNKTAKQQIFKRLSSSLLNQGILLMEPSESIDGPCSSDFETIDLVNRLYRKTHTAARPEDLLNNTLTKYLPESLKRKRALELLLQKYVPAGILVDEKGDILHVFGTVGRFLSFSFGSATLNITGLVDEKADVVLAQMLCQIGQYRRPIKTSNVEGFNNVNYVDVEMHVLSELNDDLNYIIISLCESHAAVAKEVNEAEILTSAMPKEIVPYANIKRKKSVEQLSSQGNLQTAVQELRNHNQELQGSNQELVALNEQLQAKNEELQSVYDEMRFDERSIIEESSFGILFLDYDLKIRKLSPIAAELFGVSKDGVGRPFAAASGNVVKDIQGDLYHVFHSGELIEKKIQDEDGLVYLIRINAYKSSAESADNDQNNGVVITFTNITKLHASQSALEKIQIRFNNTLNAVSDGYFEWDIDTNYIFFSPSFYDILGYGDERPTLEHMLGENADTFTRGLAQKNLLDRHKVEEPLPFISAVGEVHWMICKGEIQFDEQRQETKLIGITFDFSKQKNVENALQNQAIELERSNNLLEKFAYIVSHDMKAPIRHIQNYLIFLQEAIAASDPEAVQEEIENIQNSSESLTELVDDVITYARVTSEKKKMGDVDMNAVLDYVINTMTPLIDEKNISIKRCDFPVFKGDKSLLTHLVQNLIGNACKYTGKNAPQLTIEHTIEQHNHVITFADNGIGFAQSDATVIFDPFSRLVTKDRFEGSGIGLSICKTVVEQHKGTIQAKSEIDVGSTFIVTLPV